MSLTTLGGDPTTSGSATDQLRSLSAKYPRPTNAVALAAVDAIQQFTDADAAVTAGLTTLAADVFCMPRGTIARMAIMAAGHEAQSDPLRSPTDKTWWAKPYRVNLWENLQTYSAVLDKAGLNMPLMWNQPLADGEPAALSEQLVEVKRDLDEIRAKGWGHCAPWIIPTRPKPGQWPVGNPTCVKLPDGADKLIPKFPSLSIPWWVWLVVGYAVSRRK